jgi:hypothetical protein
MSTDMKELVWFTVDETTMKGEVAKALVTLRKAQKASSEAKAAFETAFIKASQEAKIIQGEESLAFGYRFGKLAVAKVEAGDKKAKASTKPKFSF